MKNFFLDLLKILFEMLLKMICKIELSEEQIKQIFQDFIKVLRKGLFVCANLIIILLMIRMDFLLLINY